VKIEMTVSDKYKNINFDNSHDFADDMMKIENSDFDDVVINLDGVLSINSMGIGAIYATYMHFQDNQKNLSIKNASEKIRNLFEMTSNLDLLDLENETK